MSTCGRLFNLDTVMIDVTVKVPKLPERGGDALASDQLIAVGGGLNVMSAAHRHGMSVSYAGELGRGPFADLARRALASEGVATPVTTSSDRDLGFCLVVVDAEGERTFITSTGAERDLRASDLEQLDVGDGDVVFLSGYNLVYPDLAAVVAPWIGSLAPSVLVAFDPGPRVGDIADAVLEPVLRRCDWLLLNANEAHVLSGSATLHEALATLLERSTSEGVVIHDADQGCVVATKAIPFTRVPSFPQVVVDSNGAGDTHDGVFLAELAQGTAPLEAVRRANAAAAISVGRFGPAASPTREEVAQWFQQFSS